MACLDESLLDLYVSGRLEGGEAARAERHIDGCPACRRAIAALARVHAAPTERESPQARVAAPDASTLDGVDETGAARAEALRPADETGSRLGRYLILSRLGAGGMGVVYAAYDPDLDRKVALKLLKGDDEESRTRFLREAQAMARLHHPQVITVHDVGVADRRVYIAMELVEGGTLRAWMEERRGWRDVVRRFLDAGRGLAAAHAAGIVHRDFKPDNVLLGQGGSVRVTDFGLARSGTGTGTGDAATGTEPGRRDPAISTGRLLDAELTRTGAVMGTPAYMSPEQYDGAVVDERSDQFSFCVALFEALYGQRPFAGNTPRELAVSVQAGEIRNLPGDVPAWLRRAVVRGLAVDPAARWPSMDALLAALAADPARRWRRLGAAAVAAFVVAGGVTFAWRAGATARVEPCRPDPAAFAGVWGPGERTAVSAAFTATGRAFAGDAFAHVAAELDHRTGAWTGAVRTACEDTRVRRTASEATLERRMACLLDRRDEVRALVDRLRRVDAAALAEAPSAAQRLASIDSCDPRRLAGGDPPPADRRLSELRRRISDASAAYALGQVEKAYQLAHEAEALATAVDWPPMRAELEYLLGETARQTERRDDARKALLAAVWAFDAARDDAGRARAWMELAELGAYEPDDAASTLPLDHADAAARRARDDGLVAELDRTRGSVILHRGGNAAALPALERARDWFRTHRGAEHPETLDVEIAIVGLLSDLGRYDDAATRAAALIEPVRRAHGAVSQYLANAQLVRAVSLGKGFHAAEAEAAFTEALATQRAIYGDESAPVADFLAQLGGVRLDAGDGPGARHAFEQALAIRTRVSGADSPDTASLVGRIGAALRLEGDAAGAAEHLRRARDTIVRVYGDHHPDLPYLAAEEISALVDLGRGADARALGHWYVTITDRINGPASFNGAIARAGFADTLLVTGGDAAEAARLLEAAWPQLETMEPLDFAPHQYNLGRALWRSGRDRARARELVGAALRAYTDAGPDFAAEQAEASGWLAQPK